MHHTQTPDLQIRGHQSEATVVLEVAGRLIIEAPVQSLVDLTELMPGGGRSMLVLDLRGVSQMDCTGIGQLVKLFLKVRRLGGRFALVNIQRRQRHLLDMSGLLRLFTPFACALRAPAKMQNYDLTER